MLRTNGAIDGEFLRVRECGLADDTLSHIGSLLHFGLLLRLINALRPTNQTSASPLSLHICPSVGNRVKAKHFTPYVSANNLAYFLQIEK